MSIGLRADAFSADDRTRSPSSTPGLGGQELSSMVDLMRASAGWKLKRVQAKDPTLFGFPTGASTPEEFWAVKSFAV